jgi:glycosyltransferase involved in cell wall biosynthesis
LDDGINLMSSVLLEALPEARSRARVANPHVLFVGGVDHELRIPFMLNLRNCGFQVSAAGTAETAPFSRAGIRYYPFRFERFLNPLADWTALQTLSKLFADVRPELVQSFDTKPNLLVPFAAQSVHGVRAVRTINGLAWLYSSRSPMALALRPINRVLHRFAARSTAATIFQNREDKTFFERHRMAVEGRSWLIPGSGIDIDRFERAAASGPSPADLRQTLGLGDAEVVITVTRLTRQKGIPALLKAAELIHKVRPGVRFLLVGPRQSEGPLAVPQSELDRHAGYVTVLGQRSDIPSLLRVADVFAFPTEYREGVPRALLEAGLAGLPIVATKMPGCSDVVADAWSGFLVPPRAPRALAARILDVLGDRDAARAMGARAAELVKSEFGLDLTVARYARVYTELLNRSK